MAILTLLLWRHLIKTGNNMVSIRFLSICNKSLITYVCVYIYIVSLVCILPMTYISFP